MGGELADILRRRIVVEGPVSLSVFMAEALGQPSHGYYVTRDPLGEAGDFTTAPEISQMFGELLGLWCAQAWLDMGTPSSVNLVELGPGRGTLAADALRAMAKVPGLHAALSLHLVETSPVLRARQAERLAGLSLHWHDRLDEVPDGPTLLLANEFFDALPIRQFIRTERGWGERKVGIEGKGFGWVVDLAPGAVLVPSSLREAPLGSIVEICPAGQAAAAEIGRRLVKAPGAALIVDYGHEGPAVGDTLQAVCRHVFAPVLEAPGEADLTAHVDFAALAEAAHAAGAAAFGPVPQGGLLRALGIGQRAAALKRAATPSQAAEIDRALHRLTAEDQMGTLFKALALASPGARPPAGFEGAAP